MSPLLTIYIYIKISWTECVLTIVIIVSHQCKLTAEACDNVVFIAYRAECALNMLLQKKKLCFGVYM